MSQERAARPCIVMLGGSFDPVHCGHVALAQYCADLFRPDSLRIVPAGRPWQKAGLRAAPEHRVAMIGLAFSQTALPIFIDRQEIERDAISYTVDTLRQTRAEAGPDASLVFVIGADQLHGLNTWHEWPSLFDYAHICAVSRPGFSTELSRAPAEVAHAFMSRHGTLEQLRNAAHGMACLADGLAMNMSSTEVRNALKQGRKGSLPQALLPAAVLDYIEQHHLYRN